MVVDAPAGVIAPGLAAPRPPREGSGVMGVQAAHDVHQGARAEQPSEPLPLVGSKPRLPQVRRRVGQVGPGVGDVEVAEHQKLAARAPRIQTRAGQVAAERRHEAQLAALFGGPLGAVVRVAALGQVQRADGQRWSVRRVEIDLQVAALVVEAAAAEARAHRRRRPARQHGDAVAPGTAAGVVTEPVLRPRVHRQVVHPAPHLLQGHDVGPALLEPGTETTPHRRPNAVHVGGGDAQRGHGSPSYLPWRAECSTRILTTMGTLSYGMITSLDGYAEGPDGRFDWATPDESTHRFVNEREREFGTYLTAGACSRPCRSGPRTTGSKASRTCCTSTPTSGATATRSSTPPPWPHPRSPAPGSNAPSTSTPCGP
ncbi:protein of unknown function [Micropruina glycogenica]|uniref:Uncharacterized protein n=1 Tax=Micropruina glycogenica TaxID=75385 RepID=A0A2N9JD13_9ACTN|nr:protein of unknown function [Micropruina glycogenica]